MTLERERDIPVLPSSRFQLPGLSQKGETPGNVGLCPGSGWEQGRCCCSQGCPGVPAGLLLPQVIPIPFAEDEIVSMADSTATIDDIEGELFRIERIREILVRRESELRYM